MSENSFEIVCNGCRAAVPSDAEVCPECGTILISSAVRTPPPPTPLRLQQRPAERERPVGLQGDDLAAAYRQLAADRGPSVSPVSYAGFWVRVVATLIDSALIAATVVGLYFAGLETLAAVLYLGAYVLYYPLLEGSRLQGTVGKLLCGLAVTDLEGGRISFPRAFLRLLGRFVVSLTGGLGYLTVIFTRRRQGVHDFIAETLVLYRGSY